LENKAGLMAVVGKKGGELGLMGGGVPGNTPVRAGQDCEPTVRREAIDYGGLQ